MENHTQEARPNPFESDAERKYRLRQDWLNGFAFQHYFPYKWMRMLAEKLGRKIVPWDFDALVFKDGTEMFACKSCGNKFFPVAYTVIPVILPRMIDGRIPPRNQLCLSGNFLVSNREIMPYCGPPFNHNGFCVEYVDQRPVQTNGASCIWLAYKSPDNERKDGKPHPMKTLSAAQDIVTKMRKSARGEPIRGAPSTASTETLRRILGE